MSTIRALLICIAMAATGAHAAEEVGGRAKGGGAEKAADAEAIASSETAPAGATEDADEADTGNDSGDEANRPFIERSLILAPERVGAFALVDAHDYPGEPHYGIALRYRHDDFPDVIFDLFVYPVGERDRDEYLPTAIDSIRNELRQVEAAGKYADLEFEAPTAFDLRLVGEDGSALAERRPLTAEERPEDSFIALFEGRAEPDPARDPLGVEIVAHTRRVIAATDPDIGRRMAIRLRREGEAYQSLAYQFLRALYLHKGRVSAPMAVSPDVFARLADHAMATLVPRIVVRNEGGCSAMRINVDPTAPDSANALALGVGTVGVTGERHRCDDELDDDVPAGYRGLELDVSGLWNVPAE